MLFHSLPYLVFLVVVFVLYWNVLGGRHRAQNLLILAASYFFYGYWDYRFLGLIVFSSLVDFGVGRKVKDAKHKGWWLSCSLWVNLGLLAAFKYFDFFIDSFNTFAQSFGFQPDLPLLRWILPVGISFYTFQTLSYTIDIYRGKLEPTNNLIAFMAYVSFFPQLVAGPIERASSLLPQFLRPQTFHFDEAVDGLRQMLWGLFKKVVIADQCANLVNQAFASPDSAPTWLLVLGAIFFALQIYGDFSGYSDIAIGTSKLFGFRLSRNFAFPYFSRDIAEFWRRWHISLSTWFRDYLYIPLGGSRVSQWLSMRNVFIVFIVSGFWHGANWTFLAWGLLHALFFVPGMLLKRNRRFTDSVAQQTRWPSLVECLQMGSTFGLVCIGWIFFRADSITHAWTYLAALVAPPYSLVPKGLAVINMLALVAVFVVIEWRARLLPHPLYRFSRPKLVRWSVYVLCVFVILIRSQNNDAFIYFQF